MLNIYISVLLKPTITIFFGPLGAAQQAVMIYDVYPYKVEVLNTLANLLFYTSSRHGAI